VDVSELPQNLRRMNLNRLDVQWNKTYSEKLDRGIQIYVDIINDFTKFQDLNVKSKWSFLDFAQCFLNFVGILFRCWLSSRFFVSAQTTFMFEILVPFPKICCGLSILWNSLGNTIVKSSSTTFKHTRTQITTFFSRQCHCYTW